MSGLTINAPAFLNNLVNEARTASRPDLDTPAAPQAPAESEAVGQLREAISEEFAAGEDANPAQRSVLDFVQDQLLSGDNPDDAVAFLLNVAGTELFGGGLDIAALQATDAPETVDDVRAVLNDATQDVFENDFGLGFAEAILSDLGLGSLSA
ncbi:MAG: hypothetical protein AAGE61_02215 [Pseudomonadota bacterium]